MGSLFIILNCNQFLIFEKYYFKFNHSFSNNTVHSVQCTVHDIIGHNNINIIIT